MPLTNEQKVNYYECEQEVYKYSYNFWKKIFKLIENVNLFVTEDILPIYCFNEIEEISKSMGNKASFYALGGCVVNGHKQAVIRIGIDVTRNTLSAKQKQTIRHEIIHYALWLMDMPDEDDSLLFWCMCYIYGGGAYKILSENEKEKYLIFKELYDEHCKKLSENIRFIVINGILNYLKTNNDINKEVFEKYILDNIEQLRAVLNNSR